MSVARSCVINDKQDIDTHHLMFQTCSSTTTSMSAPHTHTRLTALFPGQPRWAGTRAVKPIWILLKQETVRGSGISWAACKSAPRSRQITTPAPHHSVFQRPAALPATQPTASKHWSLHHKQQSLFSFHASHWHSNLQPFTATIQVNVCQMGSAVRNRMILLKQFYCKHAPPENQHIQIRQDFKSCP